MAKPATVQKLKHGKALCGATFGGFVETFNWLVDFCLNLKGDKDANNANGTITLDRADESAPVIRNTAESASDSASALTGAWEMKLVGPNSYSLTNCIVNMGGLTYEYNDYSYSGSDSGFLCARWTFPLPNSPSLVVYNNISALRSEQKQTSSVYILPLYKLESGSVIADLRNIPQLGVFEPE